MQRLTARSTAVLAAWALLASLAAAQVPVTVSIQAAKGEYFIPPGFAGIGFETASLLSGHYGVSGNFFSPQNAQLIRLMQNLAVRNIRVGGGTVDGFSGAGSCVANTPTREDVDQLFQFAEEAGVKVIYSLRLLNPRRCRDENLIANDAATARWIWDHYRANLDSFAIGNEPDWHSYHRLDRAIFETKPGVPGSAFGSYEAEWEKVASAIRREVPGVQFSGPDSGAYTPKTDVPAPGSGISWTQSFAEATRADGDMTAALQHFYVGHGFTVRCGDPRRSYTLSAQQAINDMLSPNWIDGTAIAPEPSAPPNRCGAGKTNGLVYTPYPWLYRHTLAPVQAEGVPYRLTESNDFLGGVPGASNAFASALWALDYMHWWAEHGAEGVNFHNNPWIYTDTFFPANAVRGSGRCQPGRCSDYQSAVKGYGIRAFDLGGHGYVEPVQLQFPRRRMNLTAYAVRMGRYQYITLINKTHGKGSRTGWVTIRFPGRGGARAAAMVLTDGHPGDPHLSTATLGGAGINNRERWLGQWTPLGPAASGRLSVRVPPSTAEVVELRAPGRNSGPVVQDASGALLYFRVSPSGTVELSEWNRASGGAASEGSRWTALPSGSQARGSAAVVRNEDGTVEVFAADRGGEIRHIRQSAPNGRWGRWSGLGGIGLHDLRAAREADGSLIVFGLKSDGSMWQDSESGPGVGWSGWNPVGERAIRPGYAVGRQENGDLEVFGVDAQGHVWRDAQLDEARWAGWRELRGAPPEASVAVAAGDSGGLQVFGVDAEGDIWHSAQQDSGKVWSGWSEVDGERLDAGFMAGQNRSGEIVLVGESRRAPHRMWMLTQGSRPGSRFSGRWTDCGRATGGLLALGNTRSGRLQIFGGGPDGSVWTKRQTQASHWSGWADLGGKNAQPGRAPQ